MRIRPALPEDRPAVERILKRWHALHVARRGELLHALDHPALVADGEGAVVGVLVYVVRGREWEILALYVDERRRGAGTALVAEARALAERAGCTRVWLITTNDNVDALRFYQRRGFRLAALHPGAVDASRGRIKPTIPVAGAYGIPLRDELELELDPGSAPGLTAGG